MFRVIIAGGRDFSDYNLLSTTMDHFLSRVNDEIIVVCGKARGADTLGELYAKERGYLVQYFPADWERYGKSAGYIRNTEMAKNADTLVAFCILIKRYYNLLRGTPMEKRNITFKSTFFSPSFEMIITVPNDRDAEEYIDELLDGIFSDEVRYNAEWDFVDGLA